MGIMALFDKRDIEARYYRFFFVTNYSYFLGFLIHTAFIYVFDFLHIPLMVDYNIFSSLVFLSAFILNRKGKHNLALTLIVLEIPTHAFLATHFVGWHTGFFVYLMALLPLVFFNPSWNGIAKITLAILVTAYTIGLKHYSIVYEPTTIIAKDLMNNLYYINIFAFYIVLSFLSFYYSLAARISEQELQRSYDRIEMLARTDPLTQLANRRDIMEKLALEATRCETQHKPMAIVLADIDGFKSFNDQFGHDCGDRILVNVAQSLSQSLRHNDYIGRWGGEEFILILPDTPLEEAARVAEKLREHIQTTQLEYAGQTHHITMTFGVAVCNAVADVQRIIADADRALLNGKQAGKNQVKTIQHA